MVPLSLCFGVKRTPTPFEDYGTLFGLVRLGNFCFGACSLSLASYVDDLSHFELESLDLVSFGRT